MSFYYKFYEPEKMKLIEEGKFTGMPFFYNNLPVKIPLEELSPLDFIELISRKNAIKLQ